MDSSASTHLPLVSIIIPCYNHGHLLQEAIDSIRQQTYTNTEIIVVDDGSTDNTKGVAHQNPEVKYFFQRNQGPSAARNEGIRLSKGDFIVFLDADDYLYKDALATNLEYLTLNRELAFVSGSHDKIYTASGKVESVINRVFSNHYRHFLKGNYIGMHATVMYRRHVFDRFLFDPSLRGCEEYDLYLKVSREFQVLHHDNKIAAYRFHKSNTSQNTQLMLSTALKVLNRQKPYLRGMAETSAHAEGLKTWKLYYVEELASKLQHGKEFSLYNYYTLLRYDPSLSVYHLFDSISTVAIMNQIINYIPSSKIRNKLKSILIRKRTPAPGKVKFGDFLRYAPFSTQFGYDRGGPIDRYYIENFLAQEAPNIKGRVLEIGDNAYTMLYGGDKVTKSDVLHVNESNPNATLVGDISNAPDLPDNAFDCIILTQTLHLIYDFKGALYTCYRILKPGGTLLLTVPCITPIDHDEWEDTWYWSFTDKGMKKLIEETFTGCPTEVHPYGNVFTATAFLYGMGLPEVPIEKMLYNDPHFQVTVTVKATKISIN